MQDTKRILALLLSGINPETGEVIERDNVVLQPGVQAALADALHHLCRAAITEQSPPVKLRADREWTKEDDRLLVRLWNEGASPEQLCQRLNRRSRGIRNRLLALRLIRTEKEYPLPERPGKPADGDTASRSFKPWTAAENKELEEMFLAGEPWDAIAKHLRRTERAVAYELKKLALIDEVPGEEMRDMQPRWSPADTKYMAERLNSGALPADVAQELGVSESAIKARAFYQGLSKESPVNWLGTDNAP